MPKEKAQCQQIVIKHKCGGSFTIIPEVFIKKADSDDPRYKPMCLNCFEPLGYGMIDRLESFCQEYKQTVISLTDKGFTMTVIQPEDQR